jgi:hypothetical protein
MLFGFLGCLDVATFDREIEFGVQSARRSSAIFQFGQSSN